MTLSAVFVIPLRPYPMPRPRCSCRGGFARVYNPVSSSKWRRDAAAHIREQWTYPEPIPANTPVKVQLLFHWPAGGAEAHERTCDLDNLSKSVLDAATEAELWYDDRQVTQLYCEKRITPKGKAWSYDQRNDHCSKDRKSSPERYVPEYVQGREVRLQRQEEFIEHY